MIFVYITAGNAGDAKKISRHLIEKKLIACTNIFPIESMYKWKGDIKEETEFVIIAKTIQEKYEQVKQELKEIHTYETPCIVSWEIKKGNKEFIDWVNKQVS
ncbi:divalent cation tolerance protein CutA [Candidatus Woesearchaeota archaeon]|nr:divalent cation tolerance protein CutA [Candidatus Woesearchaeota archaeon]